MEQYYQGDVLFRLVTVQKLEHASVVKSDHGKYVIARGEKTGHTHVVMADRATLYQGFFNKTGMGVYDGGGSENLTILHTDKGAVVTHDEHPALELPAGDWEVVMQRQYVPQARPIPRADYD